MNLFINTAKSNIDIMLFNDEEILNIKTKVSNNNHTIVLYECIEELNINYNELEKVYVVNGPGSYTGLRVGVIYAKTLAQALNIPVFPVRQTILLDSYIDNEYAIDLRGKKYYMNNNIISIDNLSDEILIDPQLDLKEIFNGNILNQIEEVDVKKVDIFYAKDAI